jgi:hypothetical protein
MLWSPKFLRFLQNFKEKSAFILYVEQWYDPNLHNREYTKTARLLSAEFSDRNSRNLKKATLFNVQLSAEIVCKIDPRMNVAF